MKYWILGGMAAILAACSASSEAPEKVASLDLQSMMPTLQGGPTWDVDLEESSLTFTAVGPNSDYKVVEFTGEFTNFDVVIVMDPKDTTDAKVVALIDTGSADLKDKDRQKNWPSSDWVDVLNFPIARFESSVVTQTGEGQFLAKGQLTIKGISKPVDLPFSLTIENDVAIAQGSVTLARTDFKLGHSSDFVDEGWVKFPVTVNLNLTANKVAGEGL